MRKLFLTFVIGLIFSNLYSQRFLNPVFSTVTTIPGIIYGNALNVNNISQNLLLDFYEPSGDTMAKRPLIIYIHGGGFSDTSQTRQLKHIIAFCDSFALRGYAVASIDYRLDSASTSLSNRAIINAMHDAKASIRYFKANASSYKIDTTKIFMGGESAGAITSLNASYMNAMSEVLYPSNLPMSFDNSVEGNSGNSGYSSSVRATLCLCGGSKHVSTLPVFDTSAINLSDNPALIVHGGNDPIIPLVFAEEIKTRLNHLSIYHQFYKFPSATHCPWFYTLSNSWLYLDSLVNYTSIFLYNFVSTTVGMNESALQKKNFSISPNPVSQILTITYAPSQITNEQIKIYNSIGILVKETDTKPLYTEINISELPNGIYFIRLKNHSQQTQRFIKQ